MQEALRCGLRGQRRRLNAPIDVYCAQHELLRGCHTFVSRSPVVLMVTWDACQLLQFLKLW